MTGPEPSTPSLLETMRAADGLVPRLDRHLTRMARSARALGLQLADRDEIREMVESALAGARSGVRRVRVTAAADGTVRVDVEPLDGPPPPSATALQGSWDPLDRLREHKTTRREVYRRAADLADERSAGHALLLDEARRLGETATANLVCLVRGRALTPPVEGLLPGIARGVLIERLGVEVAHLPESSWRDAEEIVAVNSLRGAMPITRVDGQPVGEGRPGRLTALAAEALADSG